MIRSLSFAPVLFALLLATGCGWFDDPTPAEARIFLTGSSDGAVRIIASKKFVVARSDRQVRAELLVADTLVRTLPFDTVWNIRADHRFYAEVDTLEGAVPEAFRMRVALDEEVRYDQEGGLADRVFRFLYVLNQPILTDESVL